MNDARKSFSVRWVSSVAAIPDDLWERCFPPPLEGRWWYAALEQAGLEDQFEFLYGVIEADAEPVGIAPAFLMDVPLDLVAPPLIARLLRGAGRLWARLRYQRTLFVGSPCADEGTVGLLPGFDLAQVVPAIQGELESLARRRGVSMIAWKDFPEEATPGLAPLVSQCGLFPAVSYPGTRMPLGGGDFEGYLKQLNATHRQKLRRKLRASQAMGPLELTFCQHPEEASLKELFDLFWQTYERGKTKFERLNLAFFRALAADDHTWFVTARDPGTGRLVAFRLSFLVGSRMINKFIGQDYRYTGNWYLYFRLWEFEVDWAARYGVLELQSGQTGYSAKFDVGLRPIPLTNYCLHRNRMLHRLFARIARDITWSTLDEDLKVYVEAHADEYDKAHSGPLIGMRPG